MRKQTGTKKEREDREAKLQLVRVFEEETTSAYERAQIVERWLRGDNECYMSLAAERKLLPIALIAGALIDAEHPILSPGGNLPTRTINGYFALITHIELARMGMDHCSREETENLATKIILNANRPVDNSEKPVDNPQNPVDNSAISVDKICG